MIPAEVQTAIDALKADVTTIGGSMFVVTLVVVAFLYFRRTAK